MAGTLQPQTVAPATSGPAKPSSRANSVLWTGFAIVAGSSSWSRKATIRHSRVPAAVITNPRCEE